MRAKLAAAIALACLPAVAPPVAAGRSDAPVPRLHWRACGDAAPVRDRTRAAGL